MVDTNIPLFPTPIVRGDPQVVVKLDASGFGSGGSVCVCVCGGGGGGERRTENRRHVVIRRMGSAYTLP